MLLTDPVSVFLWMTALLVHGRHVDAGVGLGDLIWDYLSHDAGAGAVQRRAAARS